MLKELSRKARLHVVRIQIAKGRLCCPHCGGGSPSMPTEPDQLLRCEACGQAGSHAEWNESRENPESSPLATETLATKPPGCAIERLGQPPGDCEWRIPASGKSGGLLPFGVIWCLITALFSVTFLLASITGKPGDSGPPMWVLIPIFGIFWAIGLGVLYAGFRAKNASQLLVVGLSRITLRRSLFNRQTEKSILRDGTESARLLVFYEQNEQPVHGIEIRTASGKLRFGSALEPTSKSWLVQDLNTALRPANFRTPTAHPSPLPRFSLPIPLSGTRSMPGAIIALIIGLAFLAIGIFVLPDHMPSSHPSPDRGSVFQVFDSLFNLLHSSFSLIWTGMAGIITLVGSILLVRQLRDRHRETRLEGDESEISVRTYEHARILKQESFPRSKVSAIRSFDSGSSNGLPMKRIELHVDGKALQLAGWADGAEVDEFVLLVRSALGHP